MVQCKMQRINEIHLWKPHRKKYSRLNLGGIIVLLFMLLTRPVFFPFNLEKFLLIKKPFLKLTAELWCFGLFFSVHKQDFLEVWFCILFSYQNHLSFKEFLVIINLLIWNALIFSSYSFIPVWSSLGNGNGIQGTKIS